MSDAATVYVVEDEESVRELMRRIVQSAGFRVECFANARDFLNNYDSTRLGCLVLDVRLPDMSGLELQKTLAGRGNIIPIIMISGAGDVSVAVQAMRAHAFDFLEKPLQHDVLLDRIRRAIEQDSQSREARQKRLAAFARLARLTSRERQVLDLVVTGMANKQIAVQLQKSAKTVEMHRTKLKRKLGVTSVAELVQIHILADSPAEFAR